MTPKMEAAYERAETLFTRARIIEQGVAAFLNSGQYANSNEMTEASRMLAESNAFRKDAEAIRDEARRAEQEANPKAGNKVKVHRIRKRQHQPTDPPGVA
jgi:hypothetical protein